MLCGAGPASVGVSRGGGLQGASAGLRGRQQRGREAISSVCVEVQPPVSFAQRQIISFAKTGAFPPPETQGVTGAGRDESQGRESETEAELRKQTAPQTCLSPLGRRSRRGAGGTREPRVRVQHPKGRSCPGLADTGLCDLSRSLH